MVLLLSYRSSQSNWRSLLKSLCEQLHLQSILEARRKRKWDVEMKRYRGLQQQLSDLRVTRMLREELSEESCSPANELVVQPPSINFPWSLRDTSSIWTSIIEFRVNTFIKGYMEARRKAKWDVDLMRMRELHQQLGNLRTIRAEKGDHIYQPPLERVASTPIFPWRTC